MKVSTTLKLTKIDEKLIKIIFQDYKVHNVDVLIREDITVDDLIDVIEGILFCITRQPKVCEVLVRVQQDRYDQFGGG